MLVEECRLGEVAWRQPCAVEEVSYEPGRFELRTAMGPVQSAALVVATGGLTVPKIGATPFAYRVAAQFGLPVVAPKPALVPLAFAPELLARYGDLAGVSLEAEAHCGKGRFRESLLFTHRGLSGPVILQISSYWQQAGGSEAIRIDLMPGTDARAWLTQHRRSAASLATLLSERWPRRFAQQWCEGHWWTLPVAQMPERELDQVARAISDWRVRPSGTLGFNKAEVTLGGVDTRALSSKTLEAAGVPGLYFIGEAVDVTGHLGGFNFQWAWASGYAAGLAA